jgi:quercetin dioxygenase-like cupin family protein
MKGKLDVTLNGETAHLGESDSWLIPAGADHRYQVIEDIVAIEATSPPARLGGKDEATSS